VNVNLEQLRKQAKELVRAAKAGEPEALAKLGDLPSRLASAQLVLAREHGHASWSALVHALVEQPFRTDLEYYDGRAEGIATTSAVPLDEARRELAVRHGLPSWDALERRLGVLEAEPTPFMLAYRALEDCDRERLVELLDRHPELVRARGTNGNDLLGMAGGHDLVRLLLDRGADPDRGNDYGWTKLHQAGYSNDTGLARILLAAGARTDPSARGDGGTPLIAALFWGHREVARLLGDEPRNLRVAAGLGRVDLIEELRGTPAAGAHRGFYRPHGGFPRWEPSDDPQEVLDEALVWAAKSDRVEAVSALVALGARVDADPYRGTPLAWAAVNGRLDAIRRLLALGAEVDQRGTFGGPTHGEGVTALHLAAQSGQVEAVEELLAAGADPGLKDALHGGTAAGWAHVGCHFALEKRLRSLL
jgi:ankyrin repeat protein/antitoxin (DNA-binding transcriptional repressor) of toxin-antitoxin stability system